MRVCTCGVQSYMLRGIRMLVWTYAFVFSVKLPSELLRGRWMTSLASCFFLPILFEIDRMILRYMTKILGIHLFSNSDRVLRSVGFLTSVIVWKSTATSSLR